MRRIVLASLLIAMGCSHARAVEKPGAPESPAGASRERPGAPPTARSPAGILRRDAIKQIQEALAGQGLPTGHTGALDGRTREGISAFQRRANLADTGLPDRETLRRLGLNPADVYRE